MICFSECNKAEEGERVCRREGLQVDCKLYNSIAQCGMDLSIATCHAPAQAQGNRRPARQPDPAQLNLLLTSHGAP